MSALKDCGIRNALELLFGACAESRSYLERCFEKTSPPHPDYFAIPKLIQKMDLALEEGQRFRPAGVLRKSGLELARKPIPATGANTPSKNYRKRKRNEA